MATLSRESEFRFSCLVLLPITTLSRMWELRSRVFGRSFQDRNILVCAKREDTLTRFFGQLAGLFLLSVSPVTKNRDAFLTWLQQGCCVESDCQMSRGVVSGFCRVSLCFGKEDVLKRNVLWNENMITVFWFCHIVAGCLGCVLGWHVWRFPCGRATWLGRVVVPAFSGVFRVFE